MTIAAKASLIALDISEFPAGVDPDDSAAADVIADWKQTPGTVGIRIPYERGQSARRTIRWSRMSSAPSRSVSREAVPFPIAIIAYAGAPPGGPVVSPPALHRNW